MASILFDKGSLLLKGNIRTPYGKWDSRIGAYRAKSMYYSDILDYFKESSISFQDKVMDAPPIEYISCKIALRPYQEQALFNWKRNKKKGIIVLPTAAGKTYVALKAISDLKTQTLIRYSGQTGSVRITGLTLYPPGPYLAPVQNSNPEKSKPGNLKPCLQEWGREENPEKVPEDTSRPGRAKTSV